MSVVGNIITNITTVLKAINGPSTYTNTMKDHQVVARAVFENEISDDAFPNFSIVFNAEQRQKEPGRLKKVLAIDIVCSFEMPLSGEVEAWLADIEKALSIDVTRGGNAYETWIPSMQRNSDVLDEIQIYIINVEVSTLANFGTL